MIIEIKYTISVIHLNHPETIPTLPVVNLDFISLGLLYKLISILSASYSKHSSDLPCLLHLYSNPYLSLHLWLFPRESLRTHISVCCCSVAQSCPTLYDPLDCSTPGLPVPHHLPELAQTHVHWVGDAIQPSHPLLSSGLCSLISQADCCNALLPLLTLLCLLK